MKTVFVTGASRGIGKIIAIQLAKANYSVALGYFKNKVITEELVEELRKFNKNIISVNINLGNIESIREAKNTIKTSLGDVDILINNGAFSQEKDFFKINNDDLDKMFSVNIKGQFVCIQEFLPYMLQKNWGKIINISSIGGQWGGSNQIHYAASKAALINLTKSIAKNYSNKGINCNTISIGLVKTDMTEREIKSKEGLRKIKLIPAGRIGSAEDIANTVKFLISDESTYITGQTINLNGGMLFN